MFTKIYPLIVALLAAEICVAQQQAQPSSDSAKAIGMQEVIVISQRSLADKSGRPLASLDQLLETSGTINGIKRGAYAWEPFINGMSSERSIITIDGMHIYGACTDKMDPVTSYVEITNLASAQVHSGPAGAAGSGIAGSLNLVRKKGSFGQKQWSGLAFAGYETNNRQKILGTALSYSRPKFFADIDLTYRDAQNYKAGNGKEILYSAFTKTNVSAIAGYQLPNNQRLEASLIYDDATDIGYPALPMDVAFARAIIGSLEYNRHFKHAVINQWQSKIYYNRVRHQMDDSQRPHVPIRMDMPGQTDTYGFFSALFATYKKHQYQFTLSGHHNNSLADMTMYPQDPTEPAMYMLTWPDVQTNYADVFAEDKINISKKLLLQLSAGIALHHNKLGQQQGLQVFYPNLSAQKTRALSRAAAHLIYKPAHWQWSAGAGFGERAPSVSEGYGIYLFNSMDGFDYIGNPHLKNEQTLSADAAVSFEKNGLLAKLQAGYFYMMHYIIGIQQPGLSPMTMGAAGVKKYTQLKDAHLYQLNADVHIPLHRQWQWNAKLGYKYGNSNEVGRLPLIQPFSYQSGLQFAHQPFTCELSMNGAAAYKNISTGFGEKELPAYTLLNFSVGMPVQLSGKSLHIKAGVDNIFDKPYSSFADWNGIYRMGRNGFVSVIFKY